MEWISGSHGNERNNEGKYIQAVCPSCADHRRAKIVREHSATEDLGEQYGNVIWFWRILECGGCECVFFGSSCSDESVLGGPKYYPKPYGSPDDRALYLTLFGDKEIASLLSDFERCRTAKLFRPAAVMARTLFEYSAHVLGVAPNNTTLGQKLNALNETGHISLRERDDLDAIIQAGNAAAHRGWKPTENDIEVVALVLHSFLDRNFTNPNRVERLRKRTPERPRRKQKKP
ncbi:DUF4145 domain-containing protein [uncultured Marivita sp.]|uniref:DUF4145 domain-containing protein n=1 Tax=uncultured Marivita sp. TaxID=888080 RepID=UPI00344AC1A0